MRVVTYNKSDYVKALKLFSLITGLPIGCDNCTAEEFLRQHGYHDGWTVGVHIHKNRVTSYVTNKEGDIEFCNENLPKIVEYLTTIKPNKSITGVCGHTAIVSQENIKVGCQTLSFEKFDEIAAAVAEMRPK